MARPKILRATNFSRSKVPLRTPEQIRAEMAEQYHLQLEGKVNIDVMSSRILSLRRLHQAAIAEEDVRINEERMRLIHQQGGLMAFVGFTIVAPAGAQPVTNGHAKGNGHGMIDITPPKNGEESE